MLNIVVPMAGRGSRFANAGYTDPKPLIPVGGKPMIQWVIDNVRPAQAHRFIFVCLGEHLQSYPEVPATLRRLCPGCEIVTVDQVTEGAACTVLLARRFIDNSNPLMIANADQFVELKIDVYLAEMERLQADGLIMTFWADHPKWSYCRMNPDGTVHEVLEKQVISNEATVGIYNFRRGADYVQAADTMIAKNLRVNNEFYVAPVYNQLITEGAKVVVARTGREYDGMYGLGVPEDLEYFLATVYEEKNTSTTGSRTEPLPADTYEQLAKIFVRFLIQKNIAGISAMLADDAKAITPSVQLRGRESVVGFLTQAMNNEPPWTLLVHSISGAVSGSSTVEFRITKAGQYQAGTVIFTWHNRKISTLDLRLVH